ncbi:MAG: transposase zinc-binding domain-containing protein, partial [Acidobacteriota bacterium]
MATTRNSFAKAGSAGGSERRRPEETILHQVLTWHLETFLEVARHRGRTIPRFVERELRSFTECGILAHGLLRVRCDECGAERLVGFSCKGRGFCPSCGGRRMADTAAHLVDHVLPELPVGQWVLSLPIALQYRLAYDAQLVADVVRELVRAVFASLRWRARREPPPRFHLVRYHGILAPCASWRRYVVPACEHDATEHGCCRAAHSSSTDADPHSRDEPASDGLPRRRYPPTRLPWAELMARVFASDVLECPRCQGRVRILAAIHPPDVTRAILECLGLPAR